MDIKDSYLHGTIGVVKSINVNADELTYTLADKQGTQVKVTLPKATVTTNGVMSNSDKVKLDNLNIDYLSKIVSYKISLPDNSGRTAYILVAKLTNWVDGKGSDYGFIGRIVGYRGGNLLNTCCYNLVAMLSSYVYNNATTYTKQLYVDKHTGYLEVLPCVVTYNGENYLALKKLGSGTEIYFEGAVKNVLPQSQWIVLNTPSGESLPDNMTVLHSANFTDAYSITTSKYFDGSSTKTLLHSGNHDGYTNKVKQNVTTSNNSYPLLLTPSGLTATTTTETYFDSGVTLNPSTNTISANISGNAATATSATNVNVSNHTTNDIEYPLVWSNETNTNSKSGNLLFKSYDDLVYNPKNKSVRIKGSISTNNGHFNYGLAFCEKPVFNASGLFVITLPVGWSNSMNSFEIDIYEYNSTNHSKIFISGYNYLSSSAWLSTSYHVVGAYSKKVRLGYQKYTDSAGNVSNRCCIILGDLDSEWDYPSVYLTAVYTSLNDFSKWKSGYSINFVSVDEATFNSTYTNLSTLTRSNWGLGSTTYYGNLVPDKNLSYNIGSSTNKFNNVYALVFNGSVKLPNNYWNTVGDDVAIGDCNVGGCLGVKSLLANANPGFYFFGESGTAIGKLEAVTNTLIKYNSVNFVLENGGTWGISISGTATKANDSDKLGGIAPSGYAVRKTLTTEDLNTITTPGFYNSGGGNSCTNKPEGVDYFGMYVVHCAGGSYYVQILFADSNSDKLWRRHCKAGTWSAWTLDELIYAKVTQTNTTGSAYYRVLLSGNASDVTETTTARKSTNLLFNPSTGNLKAVSLNLNGDIVINDGTNKDRFIKFQYNNTDSYGWRIGYLGDNNANGSNNNALSFESYSNSTWNKALIFDQATRKATFSSDVTAPKFIGNLVGNVTGDVTGDVTGNAGTATKLATKRKLWGLDFDGSTNVSGDMTGVGNITISATDNKDYFINFLYNNTPTYSWRLGYLGSGSGNANYFVIDSSKASGGNWHRALQIGNETFDATFAGTVTSPTFIGNLDGTYVNKLTGYTKATAASNIAATDTLNAALGKLEYKAHYAYNWVVGVTATDTDEYINKWSEIVGFLDSVKEGTDILDEFVTRKTALEITAHKHFKNRVSVTNKDATLYLNSTSSFNTVTFSIMKTDATEATRSFLIMRDDSVFKIANHGWNVEHLLLHEGNTNIKNGVITIAGRTITPITSLANYVTLDTALNITGLKTFKAASTQENLVGVALKLGNSGWTSNMQTAIDFCNGAQYKVPNARISVLMDGLDDRGGTMIFSTLQKHASTNPNPNELTERFRISDTGTATFSCNVNIRNAGGNALSGMTNASLMYDSYTSLNSTSYHPILGVKTNGGNVVNLGAYINGVGFYGYKNGRTENNWDWKFVFDSANGNLETTGGITLYTPEGDSPALMFRRGNIGSDTAVDWRMYVTQGHLKILNALSTIDGGAWKDVLHFAADLTNKLLTSSYHIIPVSNNVLTLGTSSLKWSNVYATTFTGNLSGNATTASSATKLDGNAETSYLRFRGLIARDYVDLTTYTSGAAAYKNYDNGIYGVEESGSRSLLIHFGNSNGSSSALEFWTQYPHNSRIKVRKTIDSNRVSGAWKELAWYSDIPTKTSQLTNDSGFLTLHQSLANYVTLNTDLTITGKKTFLADGTIFTNGTHGARLLGHSNAGWLQLGQTSGENKVHYGKISGFAAATLTSLTVSATASSFSGTVSATKEFKICTNGTNQTPKIVFDEYYNGTNNWKSEITSDFFGSKVCTETGFTHGLFITLGRNLTFSNLNVLDADKVPIARISNVLGHWFKGNLETTENITANSFVKKNGTSSQFLKADGSVDSNSYVKPSDLPSSDQSGFNRILFERFDRGTITGGNPITEQDLVGKTLIDATLVDNFKSFNVGDGYLGRLTTYLYFSLATAFNTSAYSDDGSTLYLNDAVVVTLKTCVTTDITLNFVKGWNKIVWVFNENSGGDSAYFTPSIKTASNLLYMNAFPVATPEKVHQSYVSDTSRRLESTKIIASTNYTLSNKAWSDTTFNFTSLATGTYAVQVTSGTNLVASGIMSVYTNLSDTVGDEIPLHVYGTAGWRPYLRTYANKLLISSNDASATSRTVTIKIAQIL